MVDFVSNDSENLKLKACEKCGSTESVNEFEYGTLCVKDLMSLTRQRDLLYWTEHDGELVFEDYDSVEGICCLLCGRSVPVLTLGIEPTAEAYPFGQAFGVCLDCVSFLGPTARDLARKTSPLTCWGYSALDVERRGYCQFEGDDIEAVTDHRRQIRNSFFSPEFEKRKGVLAKSALQHPDIAKEVGFQPKKRKDSEE